MIKETLRCLNIQTHFYLVLQFKGHCKNLKNRSPDLQSKV